VKDGAVELAQVLLKHLLPTHVVVDGVEPASQPKVHVLPTFKPPSVHDMVPPAGAVRGKHLHNWTTTRVEGKH
jgi:hypothetical protein